jgi:hypothetical protein
MLENEKKMSYAEQHSLYGYTEKEKTRFTEGGDVDIAETSEQVKQFIEDAIALKNQQRKLLLGKIKDDLAVKIKNETGKNLQGYSLALYSDDIKHAFNEHSDDKLEKLRKPPQRAITVEDILRFVDIVVNYNSVQNERGNCLSFERHINGIVTIITIYTRKKNRLSLKTMFVEV